MKKAKAWEENMRKMKERGAALARKGIPVLLALVCAALAVVLILGAVGIWREGAALRAEDPTEAIYTPERVADRLKPAGPLALAALVLTLAGWGLGVRTERRAERPLGIPSAGRESRQRKALLGALLAAAGVALIAGAWSGGLRETLYKAVRICAECIGLG